MTHSHFHQQIIVIRVANTKSFFRCLSLVRTENTQQHSLTLRKGKRNCSRKRAGSSGSSYSVGSHGSSGRSHTRNTAVRSIKVDTLRKGRINRAARHSNESGTNIDQIVLRVEGVGLLGIVETLTQSTAHKELHLIDVCVRARRTLQGQFHRLVQSRLRHTHELFPLQRSVDQIRNIRNRSPGRGGSRITSVDGKG